MHFYDLVFKMASFLQNLFPLNRTTSGLNRLGYKIRILMTLALFNFDAIWKESFLFWLSLVLIGICCFSNFTF